MGVGGKERQGNIFLFAELCREPTKISVCIHSKVLENIGQSKKGTQMLYAKNNNKGGNFTTLLDKQMLFVTRLGR